jgi:hypothetical protein
MSWHWLERLARGLAGVLMGPVGPERMPCLVWVGVRPARRFGPRNRG